MIRIWVVLSAVVVLVSCTQNPVSVSPSASNGEAKVAIGPEAISVNPASQEQCAFGENFFNIYHDQNASGAYDFSDILISSQVV